MSELVVMPKSDWTGILDSVRAKTGKTDLMTSGMVASEIEGIQAGGGAVAVSPKDVNFYDYDGTLLHSYTVEEAHALTELPELPTQKGLICQGWNWTLDEIKTHNRAVDVGAMYITDDGKTRLYIRIAAEGRMTVPLYFSQTVANGVTIDWGDGSATETLDGTGNVNTTHTYASIGDYVITLDVAEGCTWDWVGRLLGGHTLETRIYPNYLKRLEIGNGVKSINKLIFCHCLESITIPNSVMSIVDSAFDGNYSLAHITIPNSVTKIGNNSFKNCYGLKSIEIPDSVTSIGTDSFRNCYSLAYIKIPNSVMSIGAYMFYGCYGMEVYDFTTYTSVPTLANTNAFRNIHTDCEIRVPASLYDEWIAATNWSNYADYIVAV